MIATGIDPAAVGCAARADVEIRDGVPVLLDWRAIRRTKRKADPWDLVAPGRAGRLGCARVVRRWLVNGHAALVAVEGTPAFLRVKSRGGKAVERLVTQAEGAGAIVQALEADALRPEPDDWRPVVLLCPGNDPNAEFAAMAALGWASMRDARVRGWRSEVEQPPEWAAPHVAEACAIAVWLLRSSRGTQGANRGMGAGSAD